jgi:uncharacterized protein (TIGR03437 family)
MTRTRIWAALFLAVLPGAAPASEFSTFIGDASDYQVARIRTDAQGNTYIGGTRSSGALSEMFVMKLDPAGNIVLFNALGGKGGEAVADLAIDAAGDIYLAGSTSSPDFPLHNALQATPGPGFLLKLGPDATQVAYATYFPAAISGLAVDSSGNAYVTGRTTSPTFPVTSGLPAGPASGGVVGGSGAFVTKISAAGSQIVYSAVLVGHGKNCGCCSSCFTSLRTTAGVAIGVDAAGNAYVAGNTDTYDLPATTGAMLTQGVGAFVAKIRAAGTSLAYLTYIGPTYYPISPNTNPANAARDIAVDAAGNAYVTGWTFDPAFPATPGAYQTAYDGPSYASGVADIHPIPPSDAFVLKLKPDGSGPVWGSYLGGAGADSAASIAVDASGNVWIAGTTVSADFPNPQGWSQGGDFVAGFSSSGASLAYAGRYPDGSISRSIAADPMGLAHVAGASGIVAAIEPGRTPTPRIFGIANAAFGTVGGHISPGELISLYGSHIGPATPVSFTPTSAGFVPTSLGGVQVLMQGHALPLLYVSDSQINAVAPFFSSSSSPTLNVVLNSAASPEFPVVNLQTDPQIFQNADGSAKAVNQDGSLNSAAQPAPAGSIVSIWATGIGRSLSSFEDGQIPTAAADTISCAVYYDDGAVQRPADIQYAGPAPGMVAGVVQINFVVPENLGYVSLLAVQAGTRVSSYVSLYVK